MKKFDWKKYDPPGAPWADGYGTVFQIFLAVIIMALVFGFLLPYAMDYQDLWQDDQLIPGVKMTPFWELIRQTLLPFLLMPLSALTDIRSRWNYYRQGSKAWYLMKRLPDRGLMWRTCWVIPTLVCLGILAAALLYTGVCFLFYVIVTPRVCLPWV